MATYKWTTPGSLTNYLTTELNSLANATTDLGSTVIDNQTDLNVYMDLELTLASFDLSAQTAPSVDIYIIESVDGGTDYDTATDAVSAAASYPASDKLLCSFALRLGTGAEAKTAVKSGLVIPPSKFKLLLLNRTGAAFASSGNVLAYRTYNVASS